MAKMLEKIKAVLLGHAVADALGVPVEFRTRESLDADPVRDMRGYGTYSVPAGAWSDDTSMSLATLDALEGDTVDYNAVMLNFAQWLTKAKYTPTGRVFDAGGTCCAAIERHLIEHLQAPECGIDGEHFNGNGSLMRIHPFVLYAHAKRLQFNTWRELVENGSRLTHAHERSRLGCLIYAFVLLELLHKPQKATVTRALQKAEVALHDCAELLHYKRVFDPDFANIPRDGIKSSGYVVDTLEAALWCLLTTDSYRECVLKAVNLGSDTDTVAAVAGGLAGALYGYDAIPQEWLHTLIGSADIEKMCERVAGTW